MIIKDAEHAKTELAHQLIYTSGHQIVCTEIGEFNNPDILSLTKTDKLVEYEIKLSRADLMGELNSVKKCQQMLEHRSQTLENLELLVENDGIKLEKVGRCSKLGKHETYLIPKSSTRSGFGFYEHKYRPNYFYFAVTTELVPLALEVCKYINYGVLCLNDIYGSSSIKKKAGMLHREEVSTQQLWRMAHSLSFGYWRNRIVKERSKS